MRRNSPRVNPGLISDSPLWPRFNEYVIENQHGESVILPAGNAKIEYYSPFKEKELLCDFIVMTNDLRKMPNDYKPLLRFANSYGLFGLIHELEHDNNRQFFEIYKHHCFPRCFPNEPPDMANIDEWHYNYGEPIAITIEKTLEIRLCYDLWGKFKKAKATPEDISPFGLPWKQYLKEINVYPIGVELHYDGKYWQTRYTNSSLFVALKLMIIQNCVTKDQPVETCDICGNPYFAYNEKQEYCSQACRNSINVKKHRQKEKLENVRKAIILREEGKNNEEIADIIGVKRPQTIERWLNEFRIKKEGE
ncbi:helix-turn-helix domain-containing protein [Pelosinus sp. sgz500959]|uniref:helix-turn-helix domain-containing protein n=1 Tax=Pelosinus sp. sgz500959 TaxID=3242472 RepID=UPI00366C9001